MEVQGRLRGRWFEAIYQVWHRRIARIVAIGLIGAAISGGAVLAAGITQSYTARTPIATGSLVAAASGTKGEVVLADVSNTSNLLGVAVPAKQSVADITSNTGGGVQVALSGSASVFVSIIGGTIKAGDQITTSPLQGVGMKATESAQVVGVALADYDGSGSGSKTVPITTKAGKQEQTKVAAISVQVKVGYYAKNSSSVLPSALQRFSQSVAGKPVATSRIVVAGLLLFLSIGIITVILFSAVRSSMISIGRNPLAQADIYRGLVKVLLVAVVILLLAVAGVFIILRV